MKPWQGFVLRWVKKSEVRRSLLTGIASSLCCITPLAVILLGVAGLGAWTGYIDYVVLPSLTVSIGLFNMPFFFEETVWKKEWEKVRRALGMTDNQSVLPKTGLAGLQAHFKDALLHPHRTFNSGFRASVGRPAVSHGL